MATIESELKESFAKFKAVGTVHEMGMLEERNGKWEQVPLRIVPATRDEYKDGVATGKKIPCERLRGSVTLKTAKGLLEFRLNYCSKKSDGEDDKRWDVAKKIVETWVPAIDAAKVGKSGEPTTVIIQGRNGYGRTALSVYDRVDRNGKITSSLQWNADSCRRAEPNTETGCTLYANAFLKKSRKEMTTGVDPEETGRLIVELYGADSHGQCYPITCYVEEDLADDFESCFTNGQTLECRFNRVTRHIGAVKQDKKPAFGSNKGGDIEVSSGFDAEELILYWANPIEAPEEDTTIDENGNEVAVTTDYIYPATMAAAMKERDRMLEDKLKEKKEGNTSKPQSALAAKKASAKSNSFGSKNNSVAFDETDDDELPF